VTGGRSSARNKGNASMARNPAQKRKTCGGALNAPAVLFRYCQQWLNGVDRHGSLALAHLWCRDRDGGDHAAPTSLARSRSSLARPYICRLTSFSLVFCPSVWPLDQGCCKAAWTAA
jgi:hypothetical protein